MTGICNSSVCAKSEGNLLTLATMQTSSIPASATSLIIQSRAGRSTSGINSFAVTGVSRSRRVPRPAAGILPIKTSPLQFIFHQPMTFVVTPKSKGEISRPRWLIRYQLVFGGAFIIALVVGTIKRAMCRAPFLATAINIMWVIFDLSLLKVLIPAVLYQGFQPNQSLVQVEGSL